MNIFKSFRQNLIDIVTQLGGEKNLPLEKVAVERPKDPSHGDLSTNAAMVLSKSMGLPPQVLAENICALFKDHPAIESLSVVKPGFINFTLKTNYWQSLLGSILEEGQNYGAANIGRGLLVNLEYVSANPTGPIHAGHGRVAIVADVLGRLLEKVGYKVIREYLINDAGRQTATLARSLHLRYREALGQNIPEIPEGYYPGEYLKDVAQKLVQKEGDKWLHSPEEEWLEPLRDFAVTTIMDTIKEDLRRIDIHHDVFTSELELHKKGAVDQAVARLREKGLVYEGLLTPPKGKTVEDWEPVSLTLFKATDFGDEVDRPLKKSNGEWTYFAADIAYHEDKFLRGAKKMINVWGADHAGHVKKLVASVDALTEGAADLQVVLCQMVNFFENGQPYKMSKRAGTFITIHDVVEKVGKDAFRFMIASRRADTHFDFDFTRVLEQSKDNPVFYVQYAHARAHSVFRAAKDIPSVARDLSVLCDESEILLIKKLSEWPLIVESAAVTCDPSRIGQYMYDLAAEFHSLWNRGKENTTLRFILPEDPVKTSARLDLLRAMVTVLGEGFKIFGVTPVEEM